MLNSLGDVDVFAYQNKAKEIPFLLSLQGTVGELIDIEMLLEKIIVSFMHQTHNVTSIDGNTYFLSQPPAIHKPLKTHTVEANLRVRGWGKPSRVRETDIEDFTE